MFSLLSFHTMHYVATYGVKILIEQYFRYKKSMAFKRISEKKIKCLHADD